jgi:hypothetical protein
MLTLAMLAFCYTCVVLIACLVVANKADFAEVATINNYPLQNLRATGSRVPPIVTKFGYQAYEVLLPKGKIGGGSSNASFLLNPPGMFPTEQCRVKFKLFFDDRFEWTQSASRRVAGKLAGFTIGNGVASGRRYSDTGASYRLTFAPNQGAKGYMYPQLKKPFTGNITWDLADQQGAFKTRSYLAAGVHVFATSRENTERHFKSGQWNDVDMFIKLNTPGRYDGVMQLSINGQTSRLDNVRYRYTDIKITGFQIAPFFGGGDSSYAPSHDTRLWYAGFGFSKF